MASAALALSLALVFSAAAGVPPPQAGAERLWQEVEALRASAAESLLAAGQPPDPRRGSPPGETPLLWVTSQGCRGRDPEAKAAAVATALALIRHEADVNAVGENDLTPLLHAAYACPPGLVVALMQAGADTRTRTRGGASALALAIVDDRADNVKAMLDAGYDVARERDELTTYMSGKPEIQAMVRAVLARTEPPEPAVRWQGLEIHARLDGDAVLHVTEDIRLAATGAVTTVERDFKGWIGTDIRVSRVARLDASGREARALSRGPVDAADRYELPYEGLALRWSLRGPNDPAFAPGTPLAYRAEYAVWGGVIPIWGVRAPAAATVLSPFLLDPRRRAAQLWEAWRLAPGGRGRRYLADYDFSPFAFGAGTTLDRASLEMTFDPAWAGVKTLRREWRPVTASVGLREFLPLDFGRAGTPGAVPRGLHAAWLGAIAFLPLASLALWSVLFGGRWRTKRRLDQVPMDASWIELHVVAKDPGEVQSLLAGTAGGPFYPGATAILEGMARAGAIEVGEEAGGATLRLRVPRDTLKPWERAIVERLFGVEDAVDLEAAGRRADTGTLDLEGPAQRAFEAAQLRSSRLSPRGIPTVALVALGVVLTLSMLSSGGFQALVAALVLGSFVYQLSRVLGTRASLPAGLPLFPVALLLVPALVFSAALVLFFLAVPAHPWALAGLAALWLGLFNSLLNAARPPWAAAEVEARYDLDRARRHIAAELEKPLPALEDRWLPWILALGLEDEVEAWRRRKPAEGHVAVDASPGTLVGHWTGGARGSTAPSWAARLAG
ncbi:MAG: hypothetical protein H6Q10_1373 [Acidobacteria bacterium]|nr:hypothetical protein [Acidobacteriota bacterium]